MKKLLFFLMVLGAVGAKAQVIKGSIDMRDSTISRSIPFEVTAGTKSVKYIVKVYALTGQVTVVLIDPTDKKYVNVTIGTKTHSGGNEPSKGELSDEMNPKMPGIWKFSISSENATGTVSYQIETIKP
jgi:hypothetical protein